MEPATGGGYSKLEWFFYIIVLPLIFISILTFALLWFLDDDVKLKVLNGLNKVPLVGKLIDDEQFAEKNYLSMNNKEDLQLAVEELKSTLSDKNASLTKTEQTITSKDEEIEKLNKQIEELNVKLAERQKTEQNREQQIADVAKIYAEMSAKNAAKIISNLSIQEATLILNQMGIDAKSEILEKMDSQKAAELSILLKDMAYSEDQDISALQERVNQLVKQIDELKGSNVDKVNYEQLALTYANMDPVIAAETLNSLSSHDSNKAINILKAMEPISRSRIFSEMDAGDAASFTARLAE